MDRRDEYINAAKRKLDEWEVDIEHVERNIQKNIQKAGKDIQVSYREDVVALRKKWSEAKVQLARLQDAGEDNWEKVKQGTENTWDSLKEGVEKIKDKFK